MNRTQCALYALCAVLCMNTEVRGQSSSIVIQEAIVCKNKSTANRIARNIFAAMADKRRGPYRIATIIESREKQGCWTFEIDDENEADVWDEKPSLELKTFFLDHDTYVRVISLTDTVGRPTTGAAFIVLIAQDVSKALQEYEQRRLFRKATF